MDRLYVFLIRNDIWIYILSAIGLVWYLTEYWRSRRILRSAVYGLEKEKGIRIRQRSLSLVFFFLAIIAIVTYVNLSVAPTLPVELLKPPTPTPNIFSTPLSRPTSVDSVGVETLEIAPTVTLPGSRPEVTATSDTSTIIEEPTGTPFPQITTGDCPPDINITSPPNGTAVGNSFTLFGTAAGGELTSYNLEALGPDTGGIWVPLGGNDNPPVQDGILGTISFENLPEGVYFIRILATNVNGDEIGQCAVELLVGSGPS